ncbi:flippase activity-associated protein Agl23 [Halorarius halobius]|uniref:flippase activity-associated protein Agl23 n=1 Tax=Halorarius halobius TaxID=2962671 RepID=UPI0020CDA44D|nr:flippase activity-associated protein Agl23 [Halorarius halobius]
MPDLRARLREDRLVAAVAALTLVALLARVVLLGSRVAHFDEGRVAYWTLQFFETGSVRYRYIIHGPFAQHVGRLAFASLGPSDFAARLPVALVGGLLPLSALLFRDHLRDVEVAGVAAFLAVNPVLVYYSRFYRSTVLTAAFCFVAFGLLVRAWDRRDGRYVLAAALFWGLGFAAKESAVVYLLCWAGAAALLVDHRLFRPGADDTGVDWLRDWLRAADSALDAATLARAAGTALGAVLVAGAVTLFFYAPRGPADGVGFWAAVSHPWRLPGLVGSVAGDIAVGRSYWSGHSLVGKLLRGVVDGPLFVQKLRGRIGGFVAVATTYAAPLLSLSLVGFVHERYARADSRPLVMATAYWGAVSVPGYMVGADINAAWVYVNAFVPLAVPAAVGLGLVVTAGRDALATDDRVSVGAVAILLAVLVGWTAVAGVSGVYLQPTSPDNSLVQYAQPEADTRAAMDAVAAADGGDADVLVYGVDSFAPANKQFVDMRSSGREPACVAWFSTLPLGWYTETHDASVACANASTGLPDDSPPVVVAKGKCSLARTVDCRATPGAIRGPPGVTSLSDSYERQGVFLRTTGRVAVVYVEESGS